MTIFACIIEKIHIFASVINDILMPQAYSRFGKSADYGRYSMTYF